MTHVEKRLIDELLSEGKASEAELTSLEFAADEFDDSADLPECVLESVQTIARTSRRPPDRHNRSAEDKAKDEACLKMELQ